MGKQLEYEILRSRDSATFNGTFQTLGGPLLHPATIVKLVNDSNGLVTISVDGINAHDVAPANSFWLYDYTANSPTEQDQIYRKSGTQYYVNGSAGTGSVYLVVEYILTL